MKKIILAILAIFFVVFGNSIVGTWEHFMENNKLEWQGYNRETLVFNATPKRGYWNLYWNNELVSHNHYFTWEQKGDSIFIVWDEDYGDDDSFSFEYKGGDEFTIIIICEEDEDCVSSIDVFTRVNPTSITTRQRAQTKSNFQISRSPSTLNLTFADNSEKRVEIVNLQGRILSSQSFSARTRSVDISNLTRGVFVLRVFENGKVSSVRFVR